MNITAAKFRGLESVALADCRFGHEHPDADFNLRKSGREDGIASLGRSLADEGWLQNAIGTTRGDDAKTVYFFGGNRRLAGARHALSEFVLTEAERQALGEAPVRVYVNLTHDEALAIAAVEEGFHVPPHIVDRYAAFAPYAASGVEYIAARFNTTPRVVQQALALANMSQTIRDAWREGEIDARCAAAFTRGRDWKHQNKVYAALKKAGRLSEHNVHAEIAPRSDAAQRFLRFVGPEAYEKAGGGLIRDFFEGDHVVLDPALVKELADKKLDQAASDLEFDGGWSWVARADALSAQWAGWPRSIPKNAIAYSDDEKGRLAEIRAIFGNDDAPAETAEQADLDGEMGLIEMFARNRAFSDAQKKTMGCVVAINVDGYLEIVAGVARPEVEKAAAPSKAKDKKLKKGEAAAPVSTSVTFAAGSGGDAEAEADGPPTLSISQRVQLGLVLTRAAASALASQTHLAKAVLLTAFADGHSTSAFRASIGNGLGAKDLHMTEDTRLSVNLRRFANMVPPTLDKLLALAAGASLGFNHFDADHAMDDADVATLCELLDRAMLTAAIGREIDWEGYFGACPKALVLQAIAQACGADEARRCEGKSKGDLVKLAVTNVPRTGWLPEELRMPGYAGPPRKAVAKQATKAKAPKKPKPKTPAKRKARK